jgi:hypothetical protein
MWRFEPLLPLGIAWCHVHQPHVEEGREHEGEEGHRRTTHQILNMYNLTLSYSSEINAVLCPLRVSLPLPCPQRDILPIQNSPLQNKINIWCTFFLNLNLLGWVWQPAAKYNDRLVRSK